MRSETSADAIQYMRANANIRVHYRDVKTPMVYEFVGQAKDGTIIVRDEDGILYKLADRL